MKKVILVALLLVGMQTVHAQKKEKWFNGKDLTGWTVYGTEKWYVDSNGLLVSESGGKQAGRTLSVKVTGEDSL